MLYACNLLLNHKGGLEMNLAITPKVQTNNKSNTSFGLRTDAITKRLIYKSDISLADKELFHNMLKDKSTDHLSFIIRENVIKDTGKYIAGLKDDKYPFATAINDNLSKEKENQPIIDAFKDYLPIKGSNDLGKLISSILDPNEYEGFRNPLEFLSDVLLKPVHKNFKATIVGLPVLNKPKIN